MTCEDPVVLEGWDEHVAPGEAVLALQAGEQAGGHPGVGGQAGQ